MTPHQDRRHSTHSTPKHSRNLYHTHNMRIIPSIQKPHNFLYVLLRTHMRPLKMIQISWSIRIYKPFVPIHIPSIIHCHVFHQIFPVTFPWGYTLKYDTNSNHYTLSSSASSAVALQILYSHQKVAAVVRQQSILIDDSSIIPINMKMINDGNITMIEISKSLVAMVGSSTV